MKETKKAGYFPIHHIIDLSGNKCPEPHERPKANFSNVAFETLLVSKREFGYLSCTTSGFQIILYCTMQQLEESIYLIQVVK